MRHPKRQARTARCNNLRASTCNALTVSGPPAVNCAEAVEGLRPALRCRNPDLLLNDELGGHFMLRFMDAAGSTVIQ